MANHPIEDIAAASQGPKWFQLYMPKSRDEALALLRRAEAAGYSAIVFAIDAFAPGSSDSTIRMGFSMPSSLKLVNAGQSGYKTSLGWDDVTFIQKNTKLPVVLKGVLTAEMAQQALAHGVSAIQVSNHGGRQLDGGPASFAVLPSIAAVVNHRVPVIFDSGVRRGNHVFKALASGADLVAIGRPVIYGLNLGGAEGVKSVFDHFNKELSITMQLAGTKTIEEVKQTKLI